MSKLSPERQIFVEDIEYKNRIMFLTGSRNTLAGVIEQAAQYRAIHSILAEKVDPVIPVKWTRRHANLTTRSAFDFMDSLAKHNGTAFGVTIDGSIPRLSPSL